MENQQYIKRPVSNPPKKQGWYDTEKGPLFYVSPGNLWSCRDDRDSEEYPKFWYEPINSTDGWIRFEDHEPEEFAQVNFVVKSREAIYNGKVMGGTYQGFKGTKGSEYSYYECTTPGVAWQAILWQYSPKAPKI